MGKTGRNDPCPCGSGKKAKKCCFLLVGEEHPVSPVDDVGNEIREILASHPVDSMEELQTLVASVADRRNREGRADFHGLSPEQMHRLLHFPFTSTHLVCFPDPVEGSVSAPILSLFGVIAEAVGEKGLKPTANGNLPRVLCREAALTLWGDEAYRERTRYGGINKEKDFTALHEARIVAELAGLLRKYKGRFILSRACRRMLAEGGVEALYPVLFRTYIEKFNWWYGTRFQEVRFLQQSFLFTLYLLKRLGSEWSPATRYEDAFLGAFPQVLDEIAGNQYFTPEAEFRLLYRCVVLRNFTDLLGLAEVEPVGENRILAKEYRVRRRPLLERAVQFLL